MKLKIYDEKDEKKEPLFLKLCKESGNRILLTIVDSNGARRSRGSILSIGSEGLCLKRSINKDFGFSLDKNGAINVCATASEPNRLEDC